MCGLVIFTDHKYIVFLSILVFVGWLHCMWVIYDHAFEVEVVWWCGNVWNTSFYEESDVPYPKLVFNHNRYFINIPPFSHIYLYSRIVLGFFFNCLIIICANFKGMPDVSQLFLFSFYLFNLIDFFFLILLNLYSDACC